MRKKFIFACKIFKNEYNRTIRTEAIIMLSQFTVKNYKSIRDEITLDMLEDEYRNMYK